MISDDKPKTGFDRHLRNIPIVLGETDAARYLRAFTHMLGDELPATDGEDCIYEAAKDAIRFIADDAFRGGFESCHSNVVEPMRENTITKEEALKAMSAHGEKVRNTIIARFEEAPGVPNQITVDIEDADLPQPKLVLQ